jgi:hypothetical protein
VLAGVIVAAVTVFATTAPASAATPVGAAASTPRSHDVVDLTLTPRVPAPNTPDVAERAAGSRRGPLLLFLPATGSRPQDYRAFLAAAVAVGYHAMGLTYANHGRSVARTCATNADCYTDVQANRLDGSDPSRFSHVRHASGILARFALAVRCAEHQDPHGGWNQYLTGDRPNWSDIVLAGHSQGGGESAFIAHRHDVRGVLMFSSPVEDDGGIVASWMHGEGATPTSRMYAFDDTSDIYAQRIVGSWRAMGLGTRAAYGTPTSSRDHLLLTTVSLGSPLAAHMETVDDAGPGVADGRPLFEPVWRWMLKQVTGPHDDGGRAHPHEQEASGTAHDEDTRDA